MSSICDSCHAGCCRTYRLVITVFDFLDLITAVGMERAVQGTCFEAMPFNENYILNNHGIHPFVFDDEEKKGAMYSLALKRDESQLFPNTLKCNFLSEEKRPEPNINPALPNHEKHPGSHTMARCSIYENRPIMCRTYPVGFNHTNFSSQLKRREDLPMASQDDAYKICPKSQLELADFELNNPASLMKKNNDLMLNDIRNQAHNQIVIKWNSQPERLSTKIIPFLLAVGNNLISAYKVNKPPITETNIGARRLENAAGALKTKSASASS